MGCSADEGDVAFAAAAAAASLSLFLCTMMLACLVVDTIKKALPATATVTTTFCATSIARADIVSLTQEGEAAKPGIEAAAAAAAAREGYRGERAEGAHDCGSAVVGGEPRREGREVQGATTTGPRPQPRVTL